MTPNSSGNGERDFLRRGEAGVSECANSVLAPACFDLEEEPFDAVEEREPSLAVASLNFSVIVASSSSTIGFAFGMTVVVRGGAAGALAAGGTGGCEAAILAFSSASYSPFGVEQTTPRGGDLVQQPLRFFHIRAARQFLQI